VQTSAEVYTDFSRVLNFSARKHEYECMYLLK